YDRIVEVTVPVSGPKEAELAKLLENTFRHVNIALVNELAMFAGDLGVDIWESIDAASTKPFGYMRFTPGPGVGGHCLPVDPSYLSWQVKRSLGASFRFVELANDINDHMPDYVVRRVQAALNRDRKAVNGSRVLLLGVSFKRHVGDCREAPSFRVARLLQDLGAEVVAADPHVAAERFPAGVQKVAGDRDDLAGADAVVLLVDHDAFDPEAVVAAAPRVLDTRAWLPGAPNVLRLSPSPVAGPSPVSTASRGGEPGSTSTTQTVRSPSDDCVIGRSDAGSSGGPSARRYGAMRMISGSITPGPVTSRTPRSEVAS